MALDPETIDRMKTELERMRARLLDLSARNPLLNYAHPRASSLRIVDEVPAIVLDRLVGNGGAAFRFAALDIDDEKAARGGGRWRAAARGSGHIELGADSADQTQSEADLPSQSERERREAAKAARARREARVAERARELGIDPSFELPAVGDSDEQHHGDNKLQTLLSPDDLETRLQKMQAIAVTAIQESGANMLHLLFGFVEWADVDGGKPRHAPLVLLPVTLARLDLDRATHTFPYAVAASGEDWSTNVTLQEKCRKEFGFALPSIEAEENLEDYFARVQEVLATAAPKGWALRRQLTLGLVSFGKILMWRDLDPATWPDRRPLLGNALLREVLGGELITEEVDDEDLPTAETRTAEYNIDELPPEYGPVPPIVVSADSSQHSVLVDVQRGESLVVQGPPGTGKSQTITNIIADAIASGKKILFVAEKKAALEVVARRLVDAGLGPFCLPLHSHTSNKREFLDGLAERIAIGAVPDPRREIEQVEELLAETRGVLTGHADRLHTPFGALGDTAFTIFWRTRRLASEMPDTVVAALRGHQLPNAVAVDPGTHARVRALLVDFAAAHAAMLRDVVDGEPHPWEGVSRGDLSFDAAELLVAAARAAREALHDAETVRATAQETTGATVWPEASDALYRLLSSVPDLGPPQPGIRSGLVEAVHARAGEESVRAAVAAADAARRAWAQVPGRWGTPGVVTAESLAAHGHTLATAIDQLSAERTRGETEATVNACERALQQLAAMEALAVRVAAGLGLSVALTPNVASRLIDIARATESLPDGALVLRSPALMAPNAAERVSTLAQRANALLKEQEQADARFAPAMRPPLTELRQMAGTLAEAPAFLPSIFSAAYRRAVRQFRRLSGGRKADRATMTREADALVRYVSSREAFLADPTLAQLFGASANGMQSPFAAAQALLNWTKQGTSAMRGLGDTGRTVIGALWSVPADSWTECAAIVTGDPIGAEAATVLQATLSDLAAWTRGALVTWGDLGVESLREWLRTCRETAASAVAVAHDADAEQSTSLGLLRDRLVLVERAWEASAALAVHEPTFRQLGMGVPPSATGEDVDVLVHVRAALDYLAQFHASDLPNALVDWLAAGNQSDRVSALKAVSSELVAKLDAATEADVKFASAGGVDLRVWYGAPATKVALATRVVRFDRAILAAGMLGRLVTQLRMRAAVLRSAMPQAVGLLESGAALGPQLPDAYSYFLSRTLSELVLRERPELDEFSGDLHETRRQQFAALDAAFIDLTRKMIAQRANQAPRIRGVGYGPVKDLTEQSLIEHEIEKTRRHIPIREMFRRAGRAIQTLKPCIMMGPQAVAQYLPPGLFHFDLVVMDEASQMRPEDALGAIARGSQLVVVGDPKQLGPTSFFDVQAADEDEIDEAAAQLAAAAAGNETEVPRGASVLERSESILLAAARRYPMRMLRWHYRSRYPQLISFSNQEFYAGDLVLFPHPGAETPEDGVNFRAVEGALYGSSVNRREAEAVVAAVRAHAATHPERTLLAVTMNQPQRELVDTMIQEAEKDDPQLAAFRARHEGTLEPFGVKNLENVQGDERDVIYVSATYGPNDRGTVAQNFGPINAVGGERRLNVLFTRAKYRLDVFCSFEPTSLRVTETSPRGLVVLRDYLRFAKEGTLAGGRFTGREPDSDFEIEVARAIRGHGYDVHAQVGVAGYFLDMAVVDPHHPGRYLLAVECDGATYHSGKSARDRDRLRQGVLEGLGWNVHRIWSTDWFRDPRGETAKVVRNIARLAS